MEKTKYQCNKCKGWEYFNKDFATLVKGGMTCNCGGTLKEVA